METNDIPPIFHILIHSSKLADRDPMMLKLSSIKPRYISCLVTFSISALLRSVKVWLICNSLVLTVTRIRAGVPTELGLIPGRDKIFSLLRFCRPALDLPSLLLGLYREPSPRV